LNIEVVKTRQAPARNIIGLEKINLADGERWVWQELEQPRLEFGHRKGHWYERSLLSDEV
jgi:hypothetical protein